MNFKKIWNAKDLWKVPPERWILSGHFLLDPFFSRTKIRFFCGVCWWKKRDWWLQMNPPLKEKNTTLSTIKLTPCYPQPQEKIDAELFCKTVTKKKAHICQNLFFPIFFKWSSFFLHPPIFNVFFSLNRFPCLLNCAAATKKIPCHQPKLRC